MLEKDRYPREPSPSDRAHDIAQDTGIPFLGTLTRQLIEAPLKKRQTDWFDRIHSELIAHSGRLAELEKQEDSIRLDEILSVIAQTYSTASRTHDQTKRRWLVNAVHETIVTEMDYDAISAYVSIIDFLQPLHIKMLIAFSNPFALYEKHFDSTTSNNTLRLFMEDIHALHDFVAVTSKDLESRGLIELDKRLPVDHGRVEMVGSLTEFGHSFLAFVQSDGIEQSIGVEKNGEAIDEV